VRDKLFAIGQFICTAPTDAQRTEFSGGEPAARRPLQRDVRQRPHGL